MYNDAVTWRFQQELEKRKRKRQLLMREATAACETRNLYIELLHPL